MSDTVQKMISSTPVRGSPLMRRSSATPIVAEIVELDSRQERLSSIANSSISRDVSARRIPENTNKLTGYIECFNSSVKLFQMNKITRQNIWNLNLIHDLYRLAHLGDKIVVDDLNLASVAIDASAKIYGMRVDDVHQDIVRLASGLMNTGAKSGQTENEMDDNSMGEGDKEGTNDAEQKKKKHTKHRKPKSHIVTDLNQINKDIDTIPELDKLFTCRATMSGEGLSSDKMYKLTLEHIGPQVMTEIQVYDEISCHAILNQNCNIEEYSINTLLNWKNADINQSLHTFKFLNWDPTQESSTRNAAIDDELLNSSQQEIAFDVNAEVEKIPELSQENMMDFNDSVGQVFYANDDDENIPIPPVLMRNGVNNREVLKSICNSNKTGRSEYSFNPHIKKIINKLYAGPLHWKCPFIQKKNKAIALFSDGRNCDTNKVRNRKEKLAKTFITINPSDPKINEDKFKSKETHKLKNSAMLDWNPVKVSLPVNLGLTSDCIDKYFLLPAETISMEKQSDATCMDDVVPKYNYDNLNDSNFCAVVDNEELYSGDEDGTNTQKTTAEGYVEAPDLVNKVKITYDTKARNVNMKLVKRQTWKIIQNNLMFSEDESRSKSEILFTQVFEELRQQLPANELINLTKGIALLAVMHLTNDNDLLLTQLNHTNFKISLPRIEKK